MNAESSGANCTEKNRTLCKGPKDCGTRPEPPPKRLTDSKFFDIVASMRYGTLNKRAEVVDVVIDHYKRARHLKTFPKKIVEDVVGLMFPHSNFEGRGFFKEVHTVHSRARKLVLKLSNAKSTRRDWEVYHRLPATVRNRYFAKIYWHTKYCSLQKYGKKVRVPKSNLKELRMHVRKFGLTDIKADNIRKIEGHFKIVDANPS
jgi:hypothetical protein